MSFQQAAAIAAVYLMEVLEQHDDWEEADVRQRKWTSVDDAASLLVNHPVRPLLDRAFGLLADGVA